MILSPLILYLITGFKKGDIIYVKRQVNSNWYEGERNAMIGIFPTSYVEVLPEGEVSSLRSDSTCRLHRLESCNFGHAT